MLSGITRTLQSEVWLHVSVHPKIGFVTLWLLGPDSVETVRAKPSLEPCSLGSSARFA
jgi:hypothetical protein